MSYAEFLERKRHSAVRQGITKPFIPKQSFPFQRHLIQDHVQRGRSALFADCGLGKTLMELAWAESFVQQGNRALILTPLAVGHQFEAEGAKFGIEVSRSKTDNGKPMVVTNYESLHHFDPSKFGAVVCDESSILKNFDGKRKEEITKFMRKVPFRLLATATAAPNDYIELGTSSEALGQLGAMDMMNRFFKNDLQNSATGRNRGEVIKWRFKGHAQQPFWQWICSWATAVRRPSDIGFDDKGYDLPQLIENVHEIDAEWRPDGWLFSRVAIGLSEQRQEQNQTTKERCESAISKVLKSGDYFTIWCNTNEEAKILRDALKHEAVEVSGADSDDGKEDKLSMFQQGKVRGLITKPKIGAWGLNFQHCNHTVIFPTHSFEQYYQCVRRFWRFGQSRPVTVDLIGTTGSKQVLSNLARKAKQADQMFAELVKHMNDAARLNETNIFTKKVEAPSWLHEN